jgi:hypothetical protein
MSPAALPPRALLQAERLRRELPVATRNASRAFSDAAAVEAALRTLVAKYRIWISMSRVWP